MVFFPSSHFSEWTVFLGPSTLLQLKVKSQFIGRELAAKLQHNSTIKGRDTLKSQKQSSHDQVHGGSTTSPSQCRDTHFLYVLCFYVLRQAGHHQIHPQCQHQVSPYHGKPEEVEEDKLIKLPRPPTPPPRLLFLAPGGISMSRYKVLTQDLKYFFHYQVIPKGDLYNSVNKKNSVCSLQQQFVFL